MNDVWVSTYWPVGREFQFRIDAKSRPGLSRAGSYATDPRVWRDGVPFRPTGVVIHQDHGDLRNTVRLQFGRDTEIAIDCIGPLHVDRDAASLVDTVSFTGRVADVTVGYVLPLPEESVKWERPKALGWDDFADIREALNNG